MEDEITKYKNFCPTCGYEGNDIECPICHIPMESLDNEIDKIKKKEPFKDSLCEKKFLLISLWNNKSFHPVEIVACDLQTINTRLY